MFMSKNKLISQASYLKIVSVFPLILRKIYSLFAINILRYKYIIYKKNSIYLFIGLTGA